MGWYTAVLGCMGGVTLLYGAAALWFSGCSDNDGDDPYCDEDAYCDEDDIYWH